MKIPFCLPYIDDAVTAEVQDALTGTGWITRGPKTKEFETELARICGVENVLAVNSWYAGASLVLKWWGIGEGDEIVVPAYTYAATALVAMHTGATVRMVDVDTDFNIDPKALKSAINDKTKIIIPVDIGGRPCDYKAIYKLISEENISKRFKPSNPLQEKLGRIMIMADAAHSIGGSSHSNPVGSLADISVFSFHSVKNITTGEGGAVALNMPAPFNNDEIYNEWLPLHLYGQTKSTHEKSAGDWRYDIVCPGIKANMNDICAAVGLAQIRQYESKLLPERKRLFELYNRHLSPFEWALIPPLETDGKSSSAHLYMLRIRDFTSHERDRLISRLKDRGIGSTVHYMPLPTLSFFRESGYNISDFPVSHHLSEHEISLPLYNGLSEAQVSYVAQILSDEVMKLKAQM